MMNSIDNRKTYIGCCGAYCATCKPFRQNLCKGCKTGFATGERDISRAKCKMKLCCFRDHCFATCADCPEIDICGIIGTWFNHKGYKYKKYKEAIEFIRKNGYERFLAIADTWDNAYGKLRQTGSKILSVVLLFCLFSWLPTGCNNPNTPTGDPLKVNLISPENNAVNLDTSIAISWSGNTAAEDSLTYTVTIYLFDSVITSASGITERTFLISGLSYWTQYRLKITATNGKESNSESFYFSTRHKDIILSTYVGRWKTGGYINNVLTDNLIFELKSDSTFAYRQSLIANDSTINSYNGIWVANQANDGIILTIEKTDAFAAYSLYFSGQNNELLYLQHTNGLDIFRGVYGTTWCFTKQPE